MHNAENIDELDRRILNLLQDDCQVPAIELAARLGISMPTCHRRLKRLRSINLIEREVAIVDPSQSRHPLSIFVEVSLHTHDAVAIERFQAQMCAEEDVTQCFNVNGDVDFLVGLSMATVDDYYKAARRLFGENPDIRTYRSFFVIKRAKFNPKVLF